MAVYENCTVITMTAGGDLRDDIYKALTVNAAGRVVLTDAATDVIVGFLGENPRSDVATTGNEVPVVLIGGGGRLKAKAAGAVTRGHLIVPSATAMRNGQVDGVATPGALANDQMAVGIALEAAADNQVFEILAMSIGVPHQA